MGLKISTGLGAGGGGGGKPHTQALWGRSLIHTVCALRHMYIQIAVGVVVVMCIVN